MQYMVLLKRKGCFHDSLFVPDEAFDSIVAGNVHDLGICEHCTCDSVCHVMRRKEDKNGEYWDKLCPILFCDLVKPPFEVEDLI